MRAAERRDAVALLRRLRRDVQRRKRLTALCDVKPEVSPRAFGYAHDALAKTRYYDSDRRMDVRVKAIDEALAALKAKR